MDILKKAIALTKKQLILSNVSIERVEQTLDGYIINQAILKNITLNLTEYKNKPEYKAYMKECIKQINAIEELKYILCVENRKYISKAYLVNTIKKMDKNEKRILQNIINKNKLYYKTRLPLLKKSIIEYYTLIANNQNN